MRPRRVESRASLEVLLDRQQSALDELLGEVRLGVRSAHHYDALEQRAATIASGLKAAFRSCKGASS